MDAIVIAPDHELYTAPDEVRTAATLLGGSILQGTIDVTAVVRFLRQRQSCDVLWIAAHYAYEGVLLTSNQIMPADVLSLSMRSLRPQLIYVNTCDSAAVIEGIARDTGASVIATITQQVGGSPSYATGTALARALANGLDVQNAYKASRPANSTNYLYVAASAPVVDKIMPVDDVRELREQLKRILVLLDGDERFEVVGLRANVKLLQMDIGKIRRDVESLRDEQVSGAEAAKRERDRLYKRQQTLNFLMAAGAVVSIATLFVVMAMLMSGLR